LITEKHLMIALMDCEYSRIGTNTLKRINMWWGGIGTLRFWCIKPNC